MSMPTGSSACPPTPLKNFCPMPWLSASSTTGRRPSTASSKIRPTWYVVTQRLYRIQSAFLFKLHAQHGVGYAPGLHLLAPRQFQRIGIQRWWRLLGWRLFSGGGFGGGGGALSSTNIGLLSQDSPVVVPSPVLPFPFPCEASHERRCFQSRHRGRDVLIIGLERSCGQVFLSGGALCRNPGSKS